MHHHHIWFDMSEARIILSMSSMCVNANTINASEWTWSVLDQMLSSYNFCLFSLSWFSGLWIQYKYIIFEHGERNCIAGRKFPSFLLTYYERSFVGLISNSLFRDKRRMFWLLWHFRFAPDCWTFIAVVAHIEFTINFHTLFREDEREHIHL